MYLSVSAHMYGLGIVSHSLQEWPVTGGKILGEAMEEGEKAYLELLLTGHEDGTVRFWDASGIALQPLYKFGSAQLFSGDEIATEGSNGANDEDEDEWPPFRKVSSYFWQGIAYTSVLSDFRVECVVRSSQDILHIKTDLNTLKPLLLMLNILVSQFFLVWSLEPSPGKLLLNMKFGVGTVVNIKSGHGDVILCSLCFSETLVTI
jgi:hypothetical protein